MCGVGSLKGLYQLFFYLSVCLSVRGSERIYYPMKLL